MPISYLIDQRQNLVRTTVAEVVAVPEILNHLAALQRDRTVGHRELLDLCGLTPPYLSSSQVWQAAQAVLAIVLKQSAGPRAIVTNNETVYSMSRIFTTLVEDAFPIRVFREVSLAEHWLLHEFQLEARGTSAGDSAA